MHRLKLLDATWMPASPTRPEPLTLVEAKAHLKVTHSDEDTLIAAYIQEARAWAEAVTHRALLTQKWRMSMDGFPAVIHLPFGRCQSVDRIAYVDHLGVVQELSGPASSPEGAAWQEDLSSDSGGLIASPPDAYWPSVLPGKLGAVTVDFTVGYGDTGADVPAAITHAMKFRIGDLYTRRSSSDERGNEPRGHWTVAAERLLSPYMLVRF